MSGVLHPVGPEPSAIYWLRRGVVLGAIALVMALLLPLTVGRHVGSGSVAAVPASSPTAGPTSLGGTGSVKPSPVVSSRKPTPSTRARTTSTTSPSTNTRHTAKGPAKLPTCAASALRTTLTGKQELVERQPSTFTLSLVNSASHSCVVTVTASTFVLTIYSGSDRIWSTGDCSSAVKATTTTVVGGKAVTWKVRWNGLRSAPKCRNRSAVPQPGTYVATAQLAKAEPARMALVMVKR